MIVPKHLAYILTVFICLSAILFPLRVTALVDAENNLEDVTCLGCHENSRQAIQVPAVNNESVMRPLLALEKKRFLESAHGEMSCVDCHQEITDSKAQHEKSALEKPNCVTCHTALWEKIKQQDLMTEKARMGVVVENITAYEGSLHAFLKKGGGKKAYCDDCHDTHYFNVPPRDSLRREEWHLTIPKVCGTECHQDELEEYASSVHGKAVLEKHDIRSAVCIDCHTAHDISKTTRDAFQLSITKRCGGCHEENFSTYRGTYHGQINTLGYAHTAKCFDCHGSHKIFGIENSESDIHPDNRLETCQQCHDGENIRKATEGFLTFSPHANTHDYDRYPQMWIAAKFMRGLLLFVFGYFWAHSLLWWFRECRERCLNEEKQQHICTDMLSDNEQKIEKNFQVRRFGLVWRIAHLLFALSVMMLILTGMTVFYSYTAWAPVVMDMLGGPKMSGLIHRVSAAIMLSIFFLHLLGVSINIYRNRKTFRWFGPDSLLPNWKDLWDAVGMFKWFVYKGPRPVFDRWTYWEKFDYWAVFWGMAIIGASGMMLAFPDVTATYFPGWVFNVVTLVHGEEAFLTVVFLFTVHFFNNHFRPDKLPPPDVVMFTGTQSLEEFKREHRLQYDRLVETGELEKYLVEVPSRPMTIGSKLLGLFLIACGLALLIIVAIGFFFE